MTGVKRRNPKRDANEPAIVEALTRAGCTVVRLDVPADLLVGVDGVTWLLEVKTTKGTLTDDQRTFAESWRGQYAIVTTEEEALRVVGR